jgi:hypothetical protein
MRPRVSIAGMLAALIVIALNLAVMRSVDPNSLYSLHHFLFACGIFPMASLLILLAVIWAPAPLRGQRIPAFLIGFEVFGAAAVFAFLAYYSLATSEVLAFTSVFGDLIRPVVVPYLDAAPAWTGMVVELVCTTLLFSLPQLLLALLGGWLASSSRLRARLEQQRTEACPSTLVPSDEDDSPKPALPRTRPASAASADALRFLAGPVSLDFT